MYNEPSVPEINLDRLSEFIEDTFHVRVEKRESIFENAVEKTAVELSSIRIFNYKQEFQKHVPTSEEIKFEMKSFENFTSDNIVLYDGFEFQKIITSLIPERELSIDNFHLVLTNKLTSTFDHSDYRYHGRALIGSNPTIISTTGIIEAPAKPREYYIDLMKNYSQGLNIESIKEKYKGEYLEYHDMRLERIIQGYAAQALFYYITGEPFCEFLDCILNNAHWQRDLIYSQIEFGRLCPRHEKILDRVRV